MAGRLLTDIPGVDAMADAAAGAAEAGAAMAGAAASAAASAAAAFSGAAAAANWPGGYFVMTPMTMNPDDGAFVATPQGSMGISLLPIVGFVAMLVAPVLLIFAFNKNGLKEALKEVFAERYGALPMVIIICCALLNLCNWILVPGAFVHAFYTTVAMLLSLQFHMARGAVDGALSCRMVVFEISVLSAQLLALAFNVGGASGVSFLFGSGAGSKTSILGIWGPVDCAAMVEGPMAAISAWCTNGWYAVMILVSTAIIFLQLACFLVYINASAKGELHTVRPFVADATPDAKLAASPDAVTERPKDP